MASSRSNPKGSRKRGMLRHPRHVGLLREYEGSRAEERELRDVAGRTVPHPKLKAEVHRYGAYEDIFPVQQRRSKKTEGRRKERKAVQRRKRMRKPPPYDPHLEREDWNIEREEWMLDPEISYRLRERFWDEAAGKSEEEQEALKRWYEKHHPEVFLLKFKDNPSRYKQYWVEHPASGTGMMVHALNAPLAEQYARKKMRRPRARLKVVPAALLNGKKFKLKQPWTERSKTKKWLSKQTGRAYKNPRQSDVKLYQAILAHLRALQWVYTTTHWTSAGQNSYGDHLLLQRLYEGLDKPIDQLGERMVAYFGPQSVDPTTINAQVQRIVSSRVDIPSVKDQLGFLFVLESGLQGVIASAWKANQAMQGDFSIGAGGRHHYSLGLDDFLMGLANDRDEAIYLLKQRLGDDMRRNPSRRNPRRNPRRTRRNPPAPWIGLRYSGPDEVYKGFKTRSAALKWAGRAGDVFPGPLDMGYGVLSIGQELVMPWESESRWDVRDAMNNPRRRKKATKRKAAPKRRKTARRNPEPSAAEVKKYGYVRAKIRKAKKNR